MRADAGLHDASLAHHLGRPRTRGLHEYCSSVCEVKLANVTAAAEEPWV